MNLRVETNPQTQEPLKTELQGLLIKKQATKDLSAKK